jgi:hypothetical protein
MAEDTLFYSSLGASKGWRNPASGTGRVGFGNLAKDYAALNRKNMRHTDNKGYPLCYVVEVEAIGSTANAHTVELYTAPETWVLKNAVRKWHIARNEMLARADALGKVGEYQKTIRPYLNVAHKNAESGMLDIVPSHYGFGTNPQFGGGLPDYNASDDLTGASMSRGEWTYTQIAAVTDQEIPAGSAAGSDTYALVLTGDHDRGVGLETNSARSFTAVSMLRSYMESRRNATSVIQDNTGGGTIQTEPNPLINLMSDSPSIGELKEIVQDIQREKPPYDPFSVADSGENALTNNDALGLVSKCFLSTSTTYLKDKEVIRVPLGLFHVRTSATAPLLAQGQQANDSPQIRIRLLGIDKCQG